MIENDVNPKKDGGKYDLIKDPIKQKLALLSLFIGGFFAERLLSDEEEIVTQEGRTLKIRRSLFDELFDWPEEESEPENVEREEESAIISATKDSQSPELQKLNEEPEKPLISGPNPPTEAVHPLRPPPRRRKREENLQPLQTPADYSNWPKY